MEETAKKQLLATSNDYNQTTHGKTEARNGSGSVGCLAIKGQSKFKIERRNCEKYLKNAKRQDQNRLG